MREKKILAVGWKGARVKILAAGSREAKVKFWRLDGNE